VASALKALLWERSSFLERIAIGDDILLIVGGIDEHLGHEASGLDVGTVLLLLPVPPQGMAQSSSRLVSWDGIPRNGS